MKNMGLKELIEMLGICAVVASLIFVGIEIQQNSAVARLEARQTIQNQNLDISLAIASNAELSEAISLMTLVATNQMEAQELDSVDTVRLYFTTYSVLLNMQTAYDSVQEGILSESSLDGLGAGFLNNDFGRAIWPQLRGQLNDDFANWVESRIVEN